MDFTENLTIELPSVEAQTNLFSEQEYREEHGLIVEVSAIHVGLTGNYNNYSAEELERSVSSWVTPYPKPIIINHDQYSDPLGRVIAGKMASEADGSPYISIQAAITSPDAMTRIMDKRYLTGSVGGSAEQATCSICEADWANASMESLPCRHRRGKTYKGKLCYFDMRGITWKEYSFVNVPGDQRSGVRGVKTSAVEEADDNWIHSARLFSLDMSNEEIMEFSESESADRNVLEGLRKKEATPVYMNLKGAFLSAMAVAESEEPEESDDSKKKPYGDVKYADPGYQSDGKKRYPLDTKDHVRAAWSYINQKKNAAKYTADQLKKIKGRIRSAAKKFGISLNDEESIDANKESDVNDNTPLLEEEDDILEVTQELSSDLNDSSATVEEEEPTEEEVISEEEEAEEVVAEENEGKPEGQESPSQEMPVSRESDETEEEVLEEETDSTEEDIEEEAGTEEVAEVEEEETSEETVELSESDDVETLESRIAELESSNEAIREENTRLRTALKHSLAERVVDMKISLGIVESTGRADALEDHATRSASSLADSLRDLASMPSLSTSKVRESYDDAPQVEESSAPILEEGEELADETGVVETEQVNEEEAIEEKLYRVFNGAFLAN